MINFLVTFIGFIINYSVYSLNRNSTKILAKSWYTVACFHPFLYPEFDITMPPFGTIHDRVTTKNACNSKAPQKEEIGTIKHSLFHSLKFLGICNIIELSTHNSWSWRPITFRVYVIYCKSVGITKFYSSLGSVSLLSLESHGYEK